MINIYTNAPIRPTHMASAPTPAEAGTSLQAETPVRASSRSLGISASRSSSPQRHAPRVSAEIHTRAADLASRFQTGEAPLLELLTEQMNLEGKLLKEHPSLPYEELANNLHPDLHAHHSRQNAAMDAHRAALNEVFAALIKQQGELDAGSIEVALNKYSNDLAEYLAIGDSRYEEVLAQPSLSAELTINIERSRAAFMDHALVVGTDIARLLDANVKKTANNLGYATALLAASKEYLESLEPGEEHDRAEAVQEQLKASHEAYQTAHDFMSELEDAYKAPKVFTDALHNARLPAVLAGYQQQRSWQNIKAAEAAAAIAQSIASALHFGGIRSSVEAKLSGRSYGTRVSVAGTALGIGHEVVNNSVRPVVQEILGELRGRSVVTVRPNEVISKALRITTVNGARHERSDEEFGALVKAIDEMTVRFTQEQNKHKVGTPQGEAEAYSAFGLAQAALEGMVSSGLLSEKTVLALMLASLFGGGSMAWLQTHGQLAATVKDAKGRDLPTHLPQAASGMLTERLAKVSGEGLRAMDIRERGPREAFLSKIFGSIQGIAISTLSADAVRHLTRDNATDIVVKLLVSGLGPAQTLSSFFAAMQSKPEATKAGVGRFAVAQLNVIDADRASLPHTTEAGTAARRGENLYHSVRGILQIPNQAAVEASATAAQWAINATTATTNAAFSISATAFKAANRHFRKAMVGEPTQQQDVELGRPNTEVRPAS